MMRKKIVAANWKMNKTFDEVRDFIEQFPVDDVSRFSHTQVIICPPYVYLQWLVEKLASTPICIGAQNVAEFEKGAYTGEIAALMLRSIGVTHCIVGHSERRQYFAESDQKITTKVQILHQHSIIPIFCCGETLQQRDKNEHFQTVERQVNEVISQLDTHQMLRTIIAYEPVWAIGTGVHATAEQAQEMHSFIRQIIQQHFGTNVAQSTIILYGGSCNQNNAHELFSCPDVDGGLIGGASLSASEFANIIFIAQSIQQQNFAQ